MNKKFDIIKDLLNDRPLSWSALSSFDWNPEEWYRKYYLGQDPGSSPEMLFGKVFAQSCEDRTPLAPVTMLSKMEYKFEARFNNIPMIGYGDTFNDVTFDELGEYKTSKKLWTQSKVDSHGQLTLYPFLNYIDKKIRPEDTRIWLECVETEIKSNYQIGLKKPIKVHHFETKRTMSDILQFGSYVNLTVMKMQDYVRNHS